MPGTPSDWRDHGVRVVRRDEISQGGAAELVARLVAKLTHTPTGIDTLTPRSLDLEPGASHQSDPQCVVEQVICVISGEALIRWGDRLECSVTAGPDDLLMVPVSIPHQIENTSRTDVLHCVLVS